jgi:DNA-binding Lrp family transcriptional regulator
MVVAYVMVKANTSEADRLRNAIGDVDGVVQVHIVAGDMDVIAKVEADDTADVKTIAAKEIGGIDGVESTTTYVAMD